MAVTLQSLAAFLTFYLRSSALKCSRAVSSDSLGLDQGVCKDRVLRVAASATPVSVHSCHFKSCWK